MGVTYNGGEYNLSANIFRRNIKIFKKIDSGETKEINGTDYTILRPENVGKVMFKVRTLQKFDVNFLKPISQVLLVLI